jgi:hypothetical protein
LKRENEGLSLLRRMDVTDLRRSRPASGTLLRAWMMRNGRTWLGRRR